ncbi:MAG: DHH family phosphoesterase [Treponema sp.]|jgi:nanoRNase/pAp phosphatase (c-di-AMP/oligoRNAs hydrolase)|nr:DHH family phosphoesterase [Treponema sp.]
MKKKDLSTIAEKSRIAANIIGEIERLEVFILVGHQDPDTDCIASLAAIGLLLRKADKDAVLYLPGPVSEHFNYLMAICKYNGIILLYGGDEVPLYLTKNKDELGIFILDTPKPSMISLNDPIEKMLNDSAIRKIEIDHHVQTDAIYAGDPGYCLVSEASSTCELIGYLTIKFSKKKGWDKIQDVFTQNISLAILTGMAGDSSMGKYLKNKKERWYYTIFSNGFDRLLEDQTKKKVEKEAVFDIIQSFSVQDKKCFDRIMAKVEESKPVFHVILGAEESAELFNVYGKDRMVMVTKVAADTLAENSGKLGLVAYYDDPKVTDFVQFRLRRSSKYNVLDLRTALRQLNIENGGGHPGAVGFRVLKDKIEDIEKYSYDLVEQIENLVGVASESEVPAAAGN